MAKDLRFLIEKLEKATGKKVQLKEGKRIPFKGVSIFDLYNILKPVKDEGDITLIAAGGSYAGEYHLPDVDELAHVNPQKETYSVFALDQDGQECEIRIKDIVNIEVSSQIQEGGQDERNFVLTAKGQQLVEDAINYREINSELRELANYSEHAGLDITQPFTDTYLEDNDLQFDLDAMMKLGVVENYKKAINESATHDCHCGGSCCDDKH